MTVGSRVEVAWGDGEVSGVARGSRPGRKNSLLEEARSKKQVKTKEEATLRYYYIVSYLILITCNRPTTINMSNRVCHFKLVLLGDTAVGKSCLVVRFVRDEFFEFQEPTIGGE